MKLIISLFLLVFSLSSFAQDAVIAVGEAGEEKDKFVIDDPELKSLTGAQKALALEVVDILKNDFVFYKHKFASVDYADKGKNSFSSPEMDKWAAASVTYFVASQISGSGVGAGIEVKVRVWSVLTKKEIFTYSIKLDQKDIRHKGHMLADGIYRSITGKPSVFNSKIAFVSDRSTAGKDILKELYLMDFDGRRVERITHFNSVVLSPAIAPDNTKIMFSAFMSHKTVSRNNKIQLTKNIDLKMFDLNTKKLTTISDRPGINSGAIFSADGGLIYLTLTTTGNAEIYEMNVNSGRMRNVTNNGADDVDPSINKDGSMMTFLSSRSGRAHIFTMNPAGGEAKRISFVGQFNATPRFSPDGKEIVFSSWVDNSFDLYRISADGNNLARLTKDFGSNEEPVYSPDGEFVVFTSKRVISRKKSVQDIYIMNRDGEILGQLTQDFGRCFSPQWTNILK